MRKRLFMCMILPVLLLTGCTSIGGTTEKKATDWITESDKVQFENMCIEAIDSTMTKFSKSKLSLSTLKTQTLEAIQVKKSSCRAYYNDELKDTIVIGAEANFQFEKVLDDAKIWSDDNFNRTEYSYGISSGVSPSHPSKTMYDNNDSITVIFKKENNQYKLMEFITNTEVENQNYQIYKKTAEQGKKIDVSIQSLIEKAVQ